MNRRVFRLYTDFQKEERWLNEMASQGLMMKSFFLGVYEFQEDTPGAYIYRIELLPNIARTYESQRYLRFLEEADVEVVTTWFRWAFYRRKASEGTFDIFSDIDSRITHFKRVTIMFLVLGLAQGFYGLTQLITAVGYWFFGGHAPLATGTYIFILALYGIIVPAMLMAGFSSYAQYRRLKKEKLLRE